MVRAGWRRVLVAAASAAALAATLPSVSGAAPGIASASLDYASVVHELDVEIPKAMADAGLVGVTISLVDGDRVILRRGYGYADLAHKRKVTPDTLFHIGSVSKAFTALAVMQLVERGLVDLDAPLSRYVPGLRLQPRYGGSTITVRSVLDHHSGIPGDVFNGLITVRRPDPGFGGWLLGALKGMPPERPVDTEWAYSNSGYVLLRDLVERVSGQSFDAYTRDHLFAVMQMPSSTFDDSTPASSAMTRNYSQGGAAGEQPAGGQRVEPREYVNGWAAGSVVSSGRDMTNFLRMMVSDGQGRTGRVVGTRTFRAMRTAQTHLPIDLQNSQGLGWVLTSPALTGIGAMFGHDGATAFNFTSVAALPDAGLAVFVSTNTVGGSDVVSLVAQRALSLAWQAKEHRADPPLVSLPDTRRAASQAELQAVAGRYATSSGYDVVQYGDAALQWTHDAQGGTGDQPAAASSYLPTLDGWWASPDTPDLQLGFRAIAGKRLMLARFGGGPAIRYYVLGQFAVAQPITLLWRSRYGAYRAVDRHPDAAPGLAPVRVVLGEKDGLLILDRGSRGTLVLRPLQDYRAYTFGTGLELGRGMGDALQFDGSRFTYLGVTYQRVPA